MLLLWEAGDRRSHAAAASAPTTRGSVKRGATYMPAHPSSALDGARPMLSAAQDAGTSHRRRWRRESLCPTGAYIDWLRI